MKQRREFWRRKKPSECTAPKDPSAATHTRERLKAIERDKGGNWLSSIIINGAGAIITFVVFVVIAVTKFTHGAWAVIVLIPIIVLMFRAIHGHYRMVAAQLSLDKAKKRSGHPH